MHVHLICMSAWCIDKQMGSRIKLSKWASLLAHGFTLKPWVTIIGRCEGRDDIGRCLYIKLRTCVCTWRSHQQRNRFSHHQKFDGPFGARFHFERFLENRCQVVWESYSWLNTMGEYLHPYLKLRTLRVHTCTDSSTKRWSFTLSKFDEPFGVRFYFERFFENRRRLVWRSYSWFDTMGKYLHPHIELGTLRIHTCTDSSTKR